jgi:hypothetical protein
MQTEWLKKLSTAGLGLTILSLILKALAQLINAPILLDLTALLHPAGLSLLGIACLGFLYRYYIGSKG